MRSRFVISMSGASGQIYGKRLLEALARADCEIHLTLTEAAAKVIAHELMTPLDLRNEEEVITFFGGKNIRYYHYTEFESPPASGSFKIDAMVIAPCSVGTLGRIASGAASNLVERAADVCLKERRKLILVPRETPFSAIHLENMLKLTNAGAIILPANPGFYHQPQDIDDLVNFVVGRILDHLGVENNLIRRYGESVKSHLKAASFEE